MVVMAINIQETEHFNLALQWGHSSPVKGSGKEFASVGMGLGKHDGLVLSLAVPRAAAALGWFDGCFRYCSVSPV